MLNGQCSGICGGASFREERLTLAEREERGVLKINDDDDDEKYLSLQVDKFNMKCPDVGTLLRIGIGHDRKEPGKNAIYQRTK